MNKNLLENKDRREFLRTAGRYSLLGLLGGGLIRLLLQESVSACPVSSNCLQCGKLERCEQSQAAALKQGKK